MQVAFWHLFRLHYTQFVQKQTNTMPDDVWTFCIGKHDIDFAQQACPPN